MSDEERATRSAIFLAMTPLPSSATVPKRTIVQQGGHIYGITLRIGRYFPGSASVIDDLLFHVQMGPGELTRLLLPRRIGHFFEVVETTAVANPANCCHRFPSYLG